MKKNIKAKTENKDLLASKEFLSHLQFEAAYAIVVKGGHSPSYYGKEKTTRLVNPVNLLTLHEKQELIYSVFISKN